MASLVISLVWSAMDRNRASFPRLVVWFHTAHRFVLAAIMLWYGWDKVLPSQRSASIMTAEP